MCGLGGPGILYCAQSPGALVDFGLKGLGFRFRDGLGLAGLRRTFEDQVCCEAFLSQGSMLYQQIYLLCNLPCNLRAQF